MGVFLIYGITAVAQEWQNSNLPGTYYSTLKKTPYGLMAGELDTRLRPGTYNGIYISKDFGNSWKQFGLENRGLLLLQLMVMM
jgi:hypothetical protein